MLGSALIGVLGLLATFVDMFFNPREALFSYLFAYAHFAGLAVAGLILLATFHASKARWPVVMRRPLEVIGETCVVFVPLFLPDRARRGPTVPVGLAARRAGRAHARGDPRAGAVPERAVLPRPGGGSSSSGRWWPPAPPLVAQQDRTGALSLTIKLRKLSSVALPFLALAVSFAAVDWLMSLDRSGTRPSSASTTSPARSWR